MKKILFYLCGRSGSGKDSMIRELLKNIPDLSYVIPYTNRAKRFNEKDGVQYHFVDSSFFNDNNNLLCSRSYLTYDDTEHRFLSFYGYPRPTEKYSILTGPWDVLTTIKDKYGNDEDFIFIPIYITVTNEEDLLCRAIKRELKNNKPKIKEVARRFCADQKIFPDNQTATDYLGSKHVIVNTIFHEAVSKLTTLVQDYMNKEEKENE